MYNLSKGVQLSDRDNADKEPQRHHPKNIVGIGFKRYSKEGKHGHNNRGQERDGEYGKRNFPERGHW